MKKLLLIVTSLLLVPVCPVKAGSGSAWGLGLGSAAAGFVVGRATSHPRRDCVTVREVHTVDRTDNSEVRQLRRELNAAIDENRQLAQELREERREKRELRSELERCLDQIDELDQQLKKQNNEVQRIQKEVRKKETEQRRQLEKELNEGKFSGSI